MSRGRAKCARPVRPAERVMYLGAAIKIVALSLLGLGILLHPSLAEAQQNPPNPASRPILFVYGFCGDATSYAWNNLYSWDNLYSSLIGRLDSTQYPHADSKYVPYRAWYDAGADQVFFQQGGTPVPEALVPYDARFFIMTFYDPVTKTFNVADVANVSILNKAYELSRVIKRITAITHIKDVIVIAHSQGGLVARAYMESLASKDN